jgi:hypothetical protein
MVGAAIEPFVGKGHSEHGLIRGLLGAFCPGEVVLADAQRWHVQSNLQNIKETLGVGVLRCLTPQMFERELWVNLLAYNLIRLLMTQAALEAGLHPRELSFNHAAQMWMQWLLLHRASGHDWQCNTFLKIIAKVRVGQRPGRLEPRARKRLPKPYPRLREPRPEDRQQIRDLGYLPNAEGSAFAINTVVRSPRLPRCRVTRCAGQFTHGTAARIQQ